METRSPEYKTPTKMQPLAVLPLFHKLEGRKVIVAGHGNGAVWKAELIAATGAEVLLLIGQEPTEYAQNILDNSQNLIKYETRKWEESDLKGAALAIAESSSDEDAISFVAAARKYFVPVNIIDRPEFCEFQFGAIVNRSPLVIGISTDGASPALGQNLRGRFEAMLPAPIANWVKKAQEWRPLIKEKELDFGARRAFWHRFAAKALLEPTRIPNDKDLDDLVGGAGETIGEVALVGAGPGNAELLTLKAVRALQRAEIVLFDDLVSQEVLDFARREAEFISVGKRGRKPSTPQADICKLLVEYAKQGKYVVRIKGGDSLIFGRATEEINACHEHNIKIEIIPGITTAQGAAASLGISLTDRDYAQRVQFITGAGKQGGLPPEINFAAIADKDVTSFIYMPRGTIENFVTEAIKNGLDENTPAAIIIDATRAKQKNHFTELKNLPVLFQTIELDGPELVMIGNVLQNLRK